ncbi:MAG: winged helix-turn-helix domain-containing protein [Candidatus Competibacteraceae bacterium]
MSGRTPLTPHLWVVEDDPASRALLVSYFVTEGYRVSEADRGDGLLERLAADPAEVVLLDIKLPGTDGLTLTRQLRAHSEIGIILVTGKGDAVDRIVGLELGADAYVTKPFNPRELLAQVKTLLRRILAGRTTAGTAASAAPAVIESPPAEEGVHYFAGWRLDRRAEELTSPEGEPVRLTKDEFQLLAALVQHPRRVLSRDFLLDQIRHRDWTPTDRTVDVLVGRLRRKLHDDPVKPALILTVHGRGYRFAAPVTARPEPSAGPTSPSPSGTERG